MKKCIFNLQPDDGRIKGQAVLKHCIIRYYKSLFGAPSEGSFTLNENLTYDIPQIIEKDNDILMTPISK